jgi:uncharacterized protein
VPIPKDLLEILVCPVTQQPLEILQAEKLAALNARIAAGRIQNASGAKVETPITEALITADGKTIYRIDDDIPNMLAEEGIPAAQLAAP